jgi:hypothetical protein
MASGPVALVLGDDSLRHFGILPLSQESPTRRKQASKNYETSIVILSSLRACPSSTMSIHFAVMLLAAALCAAQNDPLPPTVPAQFRALAFASLDTPIVIYLDAPNLKARVDHVDLENLKFENGTWKIAVRAFMLAECF